MSVFKTKKYYTLELHIKENTGNKVPAQYCFSTNKIWRFTSKTKKVLTSNLLSVAKAIDKTAAKTKNGIEFTWRCGDQAYPVVMEIAPKDYFYEGVSEPSDDYLNNTREVASELNKFIENEMSTLGICFPNISEEPLLEDDNCESLMRKTVEKIDEHFGADTTTFFAGDTNPRNLDDEEYPSIDRIAKNLVSLNAKVDRILAFIDTIKKA